MFYKTELVILKLQKKNLEGGWLLPLELLPGSGAERPDGPGCGLPAAGGTSAAVGLSGITSIARTHWNLLTLHVCEIQQLATVQGNE